MRPSCLFVVNGLGLGNSTRCHAVIEHLLRAGCRIDVLTSGNGLAYFEGKEGIASLSSMESFFYSGKDGGVSGWSTFKSIRRLLQIARTKRAQLDDLVERLAPDIAVIDSEYAIRPLRRRGIPVVGLNTSEMVVSQYLKTRDVPRSVRSHFWLVEFSDYLFHRHFCDLVLSPFPVRSRARHGRFRRIGLIVRRSILDLAEVETKPPFPSPRQLRRVVFMLSGSVHASNIPFEGHRLPFQVDIVGRSGSSSGNVTFHGRLLDNSQLLSRADALVINGGYSAVSEAFALRKPVFVVPVPGHAEQFVNAALVRELGLGFVATEDNVLEQLLRMFEADQWEGLRPMPASFELHGAREAADAILRSAWKPGRLMVAPAGSRPVPGLSGVSH